MLEVEDHKKCKKTPRIGRISREVEERQKKWKEISQEMEEGHKKWKEILQEVEEDHKNWKIVIRSGRASQEMGGF